MKSLSSFIERIFPRKHKVEPLSADQVRHAKMRIIEEEFHCVGATSHIADNNRIDNMIADIESQDILRQGRALRIIGLKESSDNLKLFTSDFVANLKAIK